MSEWLLALHSSTPTLGMALVDARSSINHAQVQCRSLGRALTNELVGSVQDLLPRQQWSQITRLAVATGPGGFTGTRLTVVLARTLAQQLSVPLHGISSFALMAPRLCQQLRSLSRAIRFPSFRRCPVGGRWQGAIEWWMGWRTNWRCRDCSDLMSSPLQLCP